jgi:hypothetical protein
VLAVGLPFDPRFENDPGIADPSYNKIRRPQLVDHLQELMMVRDKRKAGTFQGSKSRRITSERRIKESGAETLAALLVLRHDREPIQIFQYVIPHFRESL